MTTQTTTTKTQPARYYSVTMTAQELRDALKAAFPGVKFSVRSSRYSGGASIDVRWIDGPMTKTVEKVSGAFAGSTFDGMTDCKNYHDSTYNGQRVRWGADHVMCQREHSVEHLTRAAEAVCSERGWPMPEIHSYSGNGTYAQYAEGVREPFDGTSWATALIYDRAHKTPGANYTSTPEPELVVEQPGQSILVGDRVRWHSAGEWHIGTVCQASSGRVEVRGGDGLRYVGTGDNLTVLDPEPEPPTPPTPPAPTTPEPVVEHVEMPANVTPISGYRLDQSATSEHDETVRSALDILTTVCGYASAGTVMWWERSALLLALKRSYSRDAIRYLAERARGAVYFAVRADSQARHEYLVTVHPHTHPTCDCMAGVNGKPCKHAGIALGLWAETAAKRAQLVEVERQAQQLRDELAHLSREDRRDYGDLMAAHYDAMEAAQAGR